MATMSQNTNASSTGTVTNHSRHMPFQIFASTLSVCLATYFGVERITAVSVTRSQVASTLPSSTALTVPTFVSASSGASSGASESYCTVSVMPEVSQLSGSRTEMLSFARTTTLSRPSAYSTCGMSTRAVSASTCTLFK